MREHNFKNVFFLLMLMCSLCLLNACKQADEPNPEELGYDYTYFPLTIGSYVVYDVHEVVYAVQTDSVVKRYQEKYVVQDTLNGSNTVDNPNLWVYARYKRDDSTKPWVPDSIWNINFSVGNKILVVTENNVHIAKLVFPLKNNLSWDANSQNIYSKFNDTYKIVNYAQPFKIGSTSFEKTLTVNQHSFSDCISKDVRKEIYASNVGMIYRLIQVYNYPQYLPSNPDYCNKVISSGWYKEIVYNSHGKE